MPPIEVAVDVEALVVAFLKSRSEVSTLVGSRVSDAFPEQTSLPRVRVTRTGGVSPYPHHLDHPRLYIECFGNTKAEAKRVGSVVSAVLKQLPGTHAEGVVGGVSDIVGLGFIPDRATAKRTAVPRYVFVTTVTTHPNPS